ncbi:hypothetical protein LCGC14_1096310 [marine sediment metagenome]|uniref:Uncharacterized protein n=1 Tax=marine sediment metagenome TaxID=412755 RepID=A0A0F9MAU8_9ZZZZ
MEVFWFMIKPLLIGWELLGWWLIPLIIFAFLGVMFLYIKYVSGTRAGQ